MSIPSDWPEQFNSFVARFKANSQAQEFLGERPFGNYVLAEPQPARCWNDYAQWASELPGWCFRGQREAGWLLLTSLDRAVRREIKDEDVTGYYHLDREEEGLKYREGFRHEVGRHGLNMPPDGDSGSQFALMQHYGTPTRFLDWSTSPHVAAYFAMEKEAQEDNKRSVVWAIDLDWLENRGRQALRETGWARHDDEDSTQWESRLLAECHEPVIIKVNPIEPSDRMIAQKGVLLCNLLPEAFFFGSLMQMMIYPDTVQQPVIRKIEIDAICRVEFLEKLRAMNIHKAALFPAIAIGR